MAPDEPTTDYYPPPPPPPPPPPAAPPARRLERSRRDRKIAGVCGGLGEYFDLDPVIFRIGFVVLTVAGGSGLLLYLAAMIFLPEEGRRRSIGESLPRTGRHHWLPVVLLVVGALMLSGQMFDHRGGGFGFGFTLLAIGGFILWRRSQHDTPWHDGDHHDIDAPRPPPAPDGMYPPRWTPPTPDVPWTAPGVTPWSPADDGIADDTGAYTTARDPLLEQADELPYSPPIWPPLDLPPEPRQRSMTPILFSFLLLLGGVAAILSTTGVMHITVGVYLAIALIVTGLALLVGAWRGQTRGLIVVAVLLTVALSVASVVKEPLRGGLGERTWAPTTLSQLDRPYRLGAGQATLDLRRLKVPPGRHVVAAKVGLGQLKVLVPFTTNVVAQAEADFGESRIFGEQRDNGNQLEVTQLINSSEGQPTLVLHLHVGAGQVEVTRAAAA